MEYVKKFDEWNILKTKVNKSKKEIRSFKEGQIWWVNLGVNIGHEGDGKGAGFTRPVIVIKKFNRELFLAIPLSSVIKENKYYFKIDTPKGVSSALISQIRVLSSKRLVGYLGKLDVNNLKKVSTAIKKFLPLQ